jgi:hypothetical protein
VPSAISQVQIDAKELDLLWEADLIENKDIGRYFLSIKGTGAPRFQIGDTIETVAILKTEDTEAH